MIPFGVPASPGKVLGGILRNWPDFDFKVFSEEAKMPEISLKSQNWPIFRIFRTVCVVTQRNGTDSIWCSGISRDVSGRYILEIVLILILQYFLRGKYA